MQRVANAALEPAPVHAVIGLEVPDGISRNTWSASQVIPWAVIPENLAKISWGCGKVMQAASRPSGFRRGKFPAMLLRFERRKHGRQRRVGRRSHPQPGAQGVAQTGFA